MPSPAALPLYLQISEMLIRDIQSGKLIEGERLPPERDMAAGLGISVGTLRKALASLTERGLLARIQGSGNYIKTSSEPAGIYAFFRLETLDGGGLPTARVLSAELRPKPDYLREFGTDGQAHRIRRVRSLSGVPVALEEIWLDAAYAPVLPGGALPESLYWYYANRLGLRIQRAEDRVGLGRMPAWGGAAELTPGAVCGRVDRTSWDQDGKSAEVSVTWFDAERARYVSRLK